jgi:hypothetical protein
MKPSSSDRSSPFTVEGEVTKVDAKKGWVDVKTAEGRMKLHYPPPALDNVKNGDRVTVEIGMRAVNAVKVVGPSINDTHPQRHSPLADVERVTRRSSRGQ